MAKTLARVNFDSPNDDATTWQQPALSSSSHHRRRSRSTTFGGLSSSLALLILFVFGPSAADASTLGKNKKFGLSPASSGESSSSSSSNKETWSFDETTPPTESELRPIMGRCDWGRDEMLASNKYWGVELTQAEILELDAALETVKKSPDFELLDGWQPMGVTQENFPLKKLAQTLSKMAEELEDGAGAVMIKNMPVDRYSLEDLGVVYAGVNAYLGRWVPQSSAGLRSKTRGYGLPLGKVFAEMKGNTPSGGKQANNYFRLHTDRCDCITLLCVRPAPAGGASRICSAARVHNTMLTECPELCARLYHPYYRIWEGKDGAFALPVWSVRDGKLTTQVSPSYIENAQLLPHVPKLDADGVEAVDIMEEVGLRESIEFTMQPGMVYWLNNHAVYHGRDSWRYSEGDDQTNNRLMLRMWLSPYKTRALPDTDAYTLVWGNTDANTVRGGLEPAIKSGLTPKSQVLADAVSAGTHHYYGLFKRSFGVDATTF